MDDSTVTFLILGVAVALFAWNRLPVGAVALGVALSLYAAGIIDSTDTFAGFGDQTVILIASLLILGEALDATGITTWAGRQLVRSAGDSTARLIVSLLLLSAALSAILTPNGAVAALLPLSVLIAIRIGRSPSHVLMPMAFSAHAGSLLVLTGSPVNILVADEAARTGTSEFSYFEFALVGVPLTIGVVGLALLLGPRLLPERRARAISADLSGHARTLIGQYEISEDLLGRHEVPRELFTQKSGVAEVIVPPRSPLIGERFFPGMITPSGDLLVLAIQREGSETPPGEVALMQGDTLLLEGSWDALDTHLSGEVLVVDDPEAIKRQNVALSDGAGRVLIALGFLIVALSTGAMPAAVAGVISALFVVVSGVMSSEQAYRSISWPAITLIAGMLPMSQALQDTGAAQDIASALLTVVGDSGPYALLAALFIVAALLGSAISNTATALILIPVAVSAAETLDVSVLPILMGLAIACSASFLTPIATPGNLMIMGPGGYRFGDYWRFGLPMIALFFAVAIGLVPLVWQF